jgi:hypothetical protein
VHDAFQLSGIIIYGIGHRYIDNISATREQRTCSVQPCEFERGWDGLENDCTHDARAERLAFWTSSKGSNGG